jgi:hypothetical protein
MANSVKGPLRNGSHHAGMVASPYSTMKSGTLPGPAASSFMCMAIM